MKLVQICLAGSLLSLIACKQSGESVQVVETLSSKSSVAVADSKKDNEDKRQDDKNKDTKKEHEDCSDERSACHDKKEPEPKKEVVKEDPVPPIDEIVAAPNVLLNFDDLINSRAHSIIVKDDRTGALHIFDLNKNLDIIELGGKQQSAYGVSMAGYLKNAVLPINHTTYGVCGPTNQTGWYYQFQSHVDWSYKRHKTFSLLKILTEKGSYTFTHEKFKEIMDLSYSKRLSSTGCRDLQRLVKAISIIQGVSSAIDQSGVYPR